MSAALREMPCAMAFLERRMAVCEFAVEYADQNQRDYRAFIKAVREGRIEVMIEG
jgi:hypothetical protein